MGFEVELMAPKGRTRRDLAECIARLRGGKVRRFFHPQSEPSKVKGLATFENLTPGFEALDADGRPVARFVDDVTLQDGLDKRAAPPHGWYRIVADDARLLRLVIHNCDAEAPLASALTPLARLFGSTVEPHPSGMMRVSDDRGASVAIGAPLPGERDRPCEIVTPPLERDQRAALNDLLGEASAMGFALPAEGATHIHFDSTRLLSAPVLANLVNALWLHGDVLKALVKTNPRCIRLGKWPEALLTLVNSAHFDALPWPKAREALQPLGLTKYVDFNLLNIATANRLKPTFEVRILPATLDAGEIMNWAALFTAILQWSSETGARRAIPESLARWLAELPMNDEARVGWLNHAAGASQLP